VLGLHERGVQRRRHALDDPLLLLARVPLGIAHDPPRWLHLHRAQDLLPRRRWLLNLGIELFNGLVIGHAALDAALQAKRLHGPRVAVLHRRQRRPPGRPVLRIQPARVVEERDDKGLDMGRLLVFVQDGRDHVLRAVPLTQPGHAALRPVVEALRPRGRVALVVEVAAGRHDVLDGQDRIAAYPWRLIEPRLGIGAPVPRPDEAHVLIAARLVGVAGLPRPLVVRAKAADLAHRLELGDA
jgi:hypothetical protein